MKIFFKTTKLKRVFESETRILQKYGPQNGKTIILRMEFLAAARTLADVPHKKPFRRHLLAGVYKGMFSIDLKHPHRLIIAPANNPLPRMEDGGIDIYKVTEIVIIDVKDTH